MTDGLLDEWMAGQKCMSRNTGQENMFSCMAKGQEKSFPDMKKGVPDRKKGVSDRKKGVSDKGKSCPGNRKKKTFWLFWKKDVSNKLLAFLENL